VEVDVVSEDYYTYTYTYTHTQTDTHTHTQTDTHTHTQTDTHTHTQQTTHTHLDRPLLGAVRPRFVLHPARIIPFQALSALRRRTPHTATPHTVCYMLYVYTPRVTHPVFRNIHSILVYWYKETRQIANAIPELKTPRICLICFLIWPVCALSTVHPRFAACVRVRPREIGEMTRRLPGGRDLRNSE
jgi:hypothetical protein